jgi:NADH-quinone oxidoreductase subunit L
VYSAIVFLPLLGAIIAGAISLFTARPQNGANGNNGNSGDHDGENAEAAGSVRAAEWITSGFLIVTAILSWIAFFDFGYGAGETFTVSVAPWIHSGSFVADWALRIDTLTVVMLVVVTTVSAIVHVYSIGYMSHDPHRPRFFAYLSLFTFAMLMLVTADNLLQMFFGWEGVGLCSYLLIGFWYHKPSANAAAIKAFIVNRVGDFGFALGIFGVFFLFGSIGLDTIFANAEAIAGSEEATLHIFGRDYSAEAALTVVCVLLFIGAMGKSAQVPLHTWLPDAMEGPTPVSALIHAATMVTAGVFMVARLSPIFELSHTALLVVTIVGALTAFITATIGLVQNDIKRVIAYSTCSQLGYMFVARKMGGLRQHIPRTYALMVIGTLSLIGFPLTAGFYSKDGIIEAAFVGHNGAAGFAFVLLVIAAVFTSFYSWRLIFMTFHGKPRASAEVMEHVHESPQVMLVPLYVLAAGALLAGIVFSGAFMGAGYEAFWKGALFIGAENEILEEIHHVPLWVKAAPIAALVLGFLVALWFYILSPATPKALAAQHDGLYRFLLNKWYFDELYDVLFVNPAKALGRFLWKKGDGWLINGFGPDGVSARVIDITNRVVKLQTGYLYHYAFAMLIGVAALVSWMMFAG